MKVRLDKRFAMPGSADAAWAVLRDIEAVAGCMPGAKITEQVDATHYKGTVAVRFGPANLSFRGEIEVATLDEGTRTLRLVGKGTDAGGGSGAAVDLTAHVEPGDAASCTLVGDSEVSMSGKVASFGARLAVPVADQVLGQFAANFAAKVAALQASATAAPEAAAAPDAASPTAAAAPAAQLDGMSLAWGAFKAWVCSLFRTRRA